MAGFIDGDGLLTVVKQARKNRPSAAYYAVVSVHNTNLLPLQFLRQEYGGRIYKLNRRSSLHRGCNWAEAFSWVCPGRSLWRLLQDAAPYLVLKGKQASLLIEFLSTKNGQARKKRIGRCGSAPLTDEEIQLRERLRARIRLLNSKGSYARLNSRLPLSSGTIPAEKDTAIGGYDPAAPGRRIMHRGWISGFFDAEGSISIEKQVRRNRPSPTHKLMISVSNSFEPGLRPFIERYGGTAYKFSETRIGSDGLKWNDSFRWFCPTASARRFLKDVSSSLKVKGRQARLALKYLEHLKKGLLPGRKEDGTFGTTSEPEIAKRDEVRRKMNSLNKSKALRSGDGGGDNSWP